MAMSFLSEISVNSSLSIFDGLELSLTLGLFSVVIFINGVYNIFSTS